MLRQWRRLTSNMNSKKPKPVFLRYCGAAGKAVRHGASSFNNYLNRHRTTKILLTFGVLFIMFWPFVFGRLDFDFGWHLQTGNYIRAHGVPAHDIYTYTARSYRWVDHEWGNDVILSFLYGLGGYGLASALFTTLWSSALLIAGGFRARLFVLVAATAAILPYVGIRPVAWTAFFLAVVLSILRSPRRRLRWYLPVLFLFWANVHAGFIAGLAIVAYFAIRERRKAAAYQLLLCFLVTFVNPYGPRLYGEIFRTLLDSKLHTQIIEWHYLTVPITAALFILLWLTGFWMFDRKRWQGWLGVSPLFFLAMLSANRNLPLFVVAATRELDTYLGLALRAIPKKLDWRRRGMLYLLTSLLVGGLIYTLYITFLPWQGNREAGYPKQAVAYLKIHRCPGNLFNSYDYGGYLIWKLPSQSIYIDGRMPTWQPYMDRYEAIAHDPAAHYPQEFRRYNIRCALITQASTPKGAALFKLLQKAHWRTAVQANGSTLLLAPAQAPQQAY
jgi:hypothetical protein